jgi:hypothetical protein
MEKALHQADKTLSHLDALINNCVIQRRQTVWIHIQLVHKRKEKVCPSQQKQYGEPFLCDRTDLTQDLISKKQLVLHQKHQAYMFCETHKKNLLIGMHFPFFF